MAEPAGLRCPACREWAVFTVGDEQAFCGNDDCRVLMWDRTRSAEENMADVHEIDLSKQRTEP